jgi:hypothetical protein
MMHGSTNIKLMKFGVNRTQKRDYQFSRKYTFAELISLSEYGLQTVRKVLNILLRLRG